MPFILNEDAAIKKKLQGMTVGDPANGATVLPVKVRYRDPEDEVARMTFPIHILELQGVYYAPERQQSGYGRLPYAPEGQPIWWNPDLPYQPDASDGPYRSDWPIAVNLDYKITTYTRLEREHQLPLMAQMVQPDRLGMGGIGYLDIPQDGTRRTMLLTGGPDQAYGKDERNDRVFRAVYLVRIFSEIVLPMDIIKPGQYPLVSLLNLYSDFDTEAYYNPNDLTDYDIKEATSIVGSSASSSWNVHTSY